MQSRFLNHHRELQVALDAVRKASVVTKQVFAERLSDAGQRTLVKDDQSPVTGTQTDCGSGVQNQ